MDPTKLESSLFCQNLKKDSLNPINLYLSFQTSLISEFREFLKEKTQLEKELGQKYAQLSQKYSVKLEKRLETSCNTSGTTDGNTGQLGFDYTNSSVVVALKQVFNECSTMGQERIRLSERFQAELMDPIKMCISANSEARKKHINFIQRLSSEKDKIYNEKDKARAKYEEICKEVEQNQVKQERSFELKNQDKAFKQYFQDVIDRNNDKNLYLLAVHCANRYKKRHYYEIIPELLYHFQTFSERQSEQLQAYFKHYNSLQLNLNQYEVQNINQSLAVYNQVEPHSEVENFVHRNPSNWNEPNDVHFNSYGEFFEDDQLILEEDSKIFLVNKSNKLKNSIEDAEFSLNNKLKELEGLNSLLTAYKDNSDLGDQDEVRENIVENWREIVLIQDNLTLYKEEQRVIESQLGDFNVGGTFHDLKSASFTIPTTCDYCDSTIWGLAKQGFTCKDCGFNCHAKCELKVTPNCTKVKGGAKNMKRSQSLNYSTLGAKTAPFNGNTPTTPRQPLPSQFSNMTPTSLSPSTSSAGVSRINRQSTPPPTYLDDQTGAAYSPEASGTPNITALALYDYETTEPGEVNLIEGETIKVVELDDGSGWIKAELKNGAQGLVPASYVQINAASENPFESPVPSAATLDSSTMNFQVKVLYDFTAENDSEMTIATDEIIQVVISKDQLDDGWWYGNNTAKGTSGLFPSNYVVKL